MTFMEFPTINWDEAKAMDIEGKAFVRPNEIIAIDDIINDAFPGYDLCHLTLISGNILEVNMTAEDVAIAMRVFYNGLYSSN